MIEWTDKEIQRIAEEHGEKTLEKHDDPFERLLISIINQQLWVESAKAIRERFFDKFDTTPQAILEADEDDINETGVSGQKIDYMKSAATYFIEDDLTVEKFSEMSDEEIISELTQIHGIGDWTAKIFLMFALGRKNVFPVEDLGIRKSMEEIYGIDSKADMVEKSADWRPNRSIASLYLWAYRD